VNPLLRRENRVDAGERCVVVEVLARLLLAERLLSDDSLAAVRIAEEVAQRHTACAAAHAMAALARYRSGQVDRRLVALCERATGLLAGTPDPIAQRWITPVAVALERAVDAECDEIRAAQWLAAGTGATVERPLDDLAEDRAWLTFLGRRKPVAALLVAAGGPDLPAVPPVARMSWYCALATDESRVDCGDIAHAVAEAGEWADRAERAAAELCARTGLSLRAGHVRLARSAARFRCAPAEAAEHAVRAAAAFHAVRDRLATGWAHLTAAVAWTTAGCPGPARSERDQARAALDPYPAGLYRLLSRRAAPAAGHRSATALSAREHEVLALLADGLTAAAIGRRLDISPRTVHHHLEHLYRKLGTRDRLTTVRRAGELGLL
jgi:DNA-binding CsgD family transcriptional regulator